MEISGFIKNSFIDFPGVIASVVFTPFCNFRCWYCHNHEIIENLKGDIDEKEVFDFLQSRKKFIDGVVVSGGEPTLQKDLFDFIKKIKQMGFKVKLDTNGTNINAVKQLVDAKLLDYIAMDIKAPPAKYAQIIKRQWPIEQLYFSINYIKNCGVDYEFRTTFSPDLDEEDITQIAKLVGKDSTYSLQQYQKVDGLLLEPHSESMVIEVAKKVKPLVKTFNLKGISTNF